MARLLKHHLDLDLSDFKRHIRVPFQVPVGTAALRVVLQFGPPGAGQVRSLITFSLFGPHGFAGSGHRHGTRHEAVLGPTWATPGFLAGPPPPGAWEAVLHTHMVADQTRAELVVESFEAEPNRPSPLAPLAPPPPSTDAWMLGDLHCHSVHSDARWTVSELASAATARGLGFIALTDHNTVSGRGELAQLAPHLLQLPGLELTTFHGHATVLGLDGYTDWTGLEPQRGMRELAARVSASGGVLTIAHPFEPGDPLCTGCAWTYFDLRPEGASHLEVWNGPWDQPKNERALAHWYSLLAQGRRVIATAGSDAHGMAYAPECGFTCTPTTGDPATLLAQVRAGNTYLGRAADLDPQVVTPAGAVPLGGEGPPGEWTCTLNPSSWPAGSWGRLIVDGAPAALSAPVRGRLGWTGPVRRWLNLEVQQASGGLEALTNPVYAAAN